MRLFLTAFITFIAHLILGPINIILMILLYPVYKAITLTRKAEVYLMVKSFGKTDLIKFIFGLGYVFILIIQIPFTLIELICRPIVKVSSYTLHNLAAQVKNLENRNY